MNDIKILWVDDEIDLLKPHILFLESKNYKVYTCQSGTEALEEIEKENFDIVFFRRKHAWPNRPGNFGGNKGEAGEYPGGNDHKK